MPNSVTSIYQSSLKVLMEELHIEAPLFSCGRCLPCCSSKMRSLPSSRCCTKKDDAKFRALDSFGPPKEYDSRGVIGASSRIIIDLEGFLQVAWHKDGADNENKDSNQKDNPREFAVIQ